MKSDKPVHNLFHMSLIVSKKLVEPDFGGSKGTCVPLSSTVAVVVNWHSALSTSLNSESFKIAEHAYFEA